MRIQLFTNWYKETNRGGNTTRNIERDKEFEICLNNNLKNPYIEKIYLFCDDKKDFPIDKKIVGVRINKRPTYNDYLKVISAFHSDISIISNSDIYFDETLSYLKFLKENECFALSRWDVNKNRQSVLIGPQFRKYSQDVWIFKNILNIQADFELGRLGCDNRFAYELKKAGYFLKNPAMTIKIHHLHLEERKHCGNHDPSKTIPPPYEYIEVIKLNL